MIVRTTMTKTTQNGTVESGGSRCEWTMENEQNSLDRMREEETGRNFEFKISPLRILKEKIYIKSLERTLLDFQFCPSSHNT